MTDLSAYTNRTSMLHLLLLETTIGLKELVIVSKRLGDKLIAEANQSNASVDIR